MAGEIGRYSWDAAFTKATEVRSQNEEYLKSKFTEFEEACRNDLLARV